MYYRLKNKLHFVAVHNIALDDAAADKLRKKFSIRNAYARTILHLGDIKELLHTHLLVLI